MEITFQIVLFSFDTNKGIHRYTQKIPLFVHFLRHLHRVDGELGTDHSAEPAVHAFFCMDDFRGMIAFFIEPIRQCQHIVGAIFDAETAAFASIIDNKNFSTR